MIRPGHRQRDRSLGSGCLGRLAGSVHFVGVAGDDDLPGTIQVCQAHTGLLADTAHRLLVETDDRRHATGAGFARLLHQLAPPTHHAQTVFKAKRIHRGQRREFAQRQTSRGIKRKRWGLFAEQLQRDPANEIYSRLRVLGAHQFLLRPGKTNAAQSIAQSLVGPIEQRLRSRVHLDQILAHTHKLGTLPGKQQCSLHHVPKSISRPETCGE